MKRKRQRVSATVPVVLMLRPQNHSIPMTPRCGGAFFTLWSYIVLGLKLYSYQETNRWYRQDLYYFLVAPTLCYQRDFPRSPKIRISKLLLRLLEMVILIQIMVGIVQQWIEPIFQRSENSFSVSHKSPVG
ncbi:hypothetical protein CRUP_032088 [Coryphaenoides rupestris]|nr:hypothetical protein CRUP_032088 [Coryphaenoides rupestris]